MDQMRGANFCCRSLAYSGCIRDLDHGSMKSFSSRVTTIGQDSMKKQAAYVEANNS
jgi:hypothetical protein